MVVFAQPCLLCLWCFLPKGFFRDRFPGSLRCRVCSQHISLPLSKPGSGVPPPRNTHSLVQLKPRAHAEPQVVPDPMRSPASSPQELFLLFCCCVFPFPHCL